MPRPLWHLCVAIFDTHRVEQRICDGFYDSDGLDLPIYVTDVYRYGDAAGKRDPVDKSYWLRVADTIVIEHDLWIPDRKRSEDCKCQRIAFAECVSGRQPDRVCDGVIRSVAVALCHEKRLPFSDQLAKINDCLIDSVFYRNDDCQLIVLCLDKLALRIGKSNVVSARQLLQQLWMVSVSAIQV